MIFDEKEVKEFYKLLNHSEETEIRIIDPTKKNHPQSIFVNSEEEFIKKCKKFNGKYNIYAGINEREKNGTEGKSVKFVETIFIDIDAPRPDTKQAATNEELKDAEKIKDTILNIFVESKMVEPVSIFSGNGYQIAIKIPRITITNENRNEVESKLQLFQERIISKYSTNDSIDKIGDLPRIIKVTGTFNIKGDNTKDRPHRLSKFLTYPKNIKENSRLLEHILSLKEEVIEITNIEPRKNIDFDCLPSTINFLYNEYRFIKPHGWMRTVEVLSSFFRGIGLNKEKVVNIILDWNSKQLYHEKDEKKDIIEIISKIFEKNIFCPNFEKIKSESSGFPFMGLKELFKNPKLTKDELRFKNPVVYYNFKLNEKNGEKKIIPFSENFIFDKDKVIRNGVFCCSKIGGELGYGFLLPKDIPVYSEENGEKKLVGKTQINVPAIITSNAEIIEPRDTEEKYKIRYSDIPGNLRLRMKLETMKDYLENNVIIPTGKEIFEMIKSIYLENLYFQNEAWYDIHTLWDIGTYFTQLFSTYPIMELRGLSGTAKSKTMKVSQLFTLNPTEIMVNPSESSIFRITHQVRPTKYIDEAEKLFQYVNGSWLTSPIVELINGSYAKGSTVPRVEKVKNKFIIVDYQCYSPSMVGSIAGLRDATETRAITHIMTKTVDNDPRGEKDVTNGVECDEYSTRIYLYAFCNYDEIERAYKEFDTDKIKKRDFQIWSPILSIAKCIDNEIFERVLKFAEKLSEQRKGDYIPEGCLDYKILEALKHLLDKGGSVVYIQGITEMINESSEKITASKTVSAHLDKLGFKEFRERDRHGSILRIDKNIYETIVSPICPNFSTYSTYSTQNKEKDEKDDVECVLNNDEKQVKLE